MERPASAACRHPAYRGDGAFGQFRIVMPDQDAVLAITSGGGDMQAVLNLVWERVLPAMQDEARAGSRAAYEKLEGNLAGLSLNLQQGSARSPPAEQASGRTYRLGANDEKLESVCAVGKVSASPGESVYDHGRYGYGMQDYSRGCFLLRAALQRARTADEAYSPLPEDVLHRGQ